METIALTNGVRMHNAPWTTQERARRLRAGREARGARREALCGAQKYHGREQQIFCRGLERGTNFCFRTGSTAAANTQKNAIRYWALFICYLTEFRL